ncbi:hypothetical protein ABH923_000287 [Leifsonia sp. EB41]
MRSYFRPLPGRSTRTVRALRRIVGHPFRWWRSPLRARRASGWPPPTRWSPTELCSQVRRRRRPSFQLGASWDRLGCRMDRTGQRSRCACRCRRSSRSSRREGLGTETQQEGGANRRSMTRPQLSGSTGHLLAADEVETDRPNVRRNNRFENDFPNDSLSRARRGSTSDESQCRGKPCGFLPDRRPPGLLRRCPPLKRHLPYPNLDTGKASTEGTRERHRRGVGGQGAKRRSKGPRSASDEGEGSPSTERSESRKG